MLAVHLVDIIVRINLCPSLSPIARLVLEIEHLLCDRARILEVKETTPRRHCYVHVWHLYILCWEFSRNFSKGWKIRLQNMRLNIVLSSSH